LLTGYDLANCMVAAEKDKGIVEVKIVEKVAALMTKQGKDFPCHSKLSKQ